MLRVCAIHGIGNDSASKSSLGARWTRYLIEGGIDACVDVAEWDSSGSPVRDLARIVTGPKWVYAQAVDVAKQVDRMRPDLIIAHSFGAVLAAYVSPNVPVVAIGSPIGHAVYGRALSLRGLPAMPHPSYDIFNDEDDVACSRLLGRRMVVDLGWMPVRIAVAGHGAFVLEHRDDLYMRHPLTHRIVRYMARRGRR